MPHELTHPYRLERVYADADDLVAEAKVWNVDFRPLDKGCFVGELLQFGTSDVHISQARFSRALRQKGLPPVNLRTIAIPAREDMQLHWRGKVIDGQSLMVFPEGAELSSVSEPDFHVYTCSFPAELLSSIGEELKVGDIDEVGKGKEAIRVDKQRIKALRGHLNHVCSNVQRDANSLFDESIIRQVSSELPKLIIDAIAQRIDECPAALGKKRLTTVELAESFIERHAGDAIRVSDICQAAGVSERTLEYAFAEHFGLGPKEYLNSYRLISVRRQLRNADPRSIRVVDVANAWGFWHMGQFAADYHERFGELPSSTLHSSTTETR